MVCDNGGTGGVFALLADEDGLEEDRPRQGRTNEIPTAEQTIRIGLCEDQRASPTGYTKEEEDTSASGGPGLLRIFLRAVDRQRVS